MNYKTNVLRILFTAFLTLSLGSAAFSQGFDIIPHYDEPRPRNYSSPEQELREMINSKKQDQELGYAAWNKLLKSLDDGYFISSETIKKVRRIYLSFNTNHEIKLKSLDELLERIYDRPDLEIELRNAKVLFLDPIKEKNTYDQENKKLWQLTTKLRITNDFYDIGSTYRAGEVALRNKDLDESEEYFSKVFHYKWFQFAHQPATNYFFEKYYSSIPFLISIKQRREDIGGLRRMEKQLATTVQSTFEPKIKEAIPEIENLQKLKEEN